MLVKKVRTLQEQMGERKLLLVMYSVMAAAVLVLFLLFSNPVLKEIHQAKEHVEDLEAQRLRHQKNIATLQSLKVQRVIMLQKELSLAIDEITGEGNVLGLTFTSITPMTTIKIV